MKKLNYFTTIFFLYKYIRKFKRNFFVFAIGWFIDMIVNLILSMLIGILIDEIVYYQNTTTFYKITCVILLLVIFICIIYLFIYAQHQYLMSMYTYSIKMDLFHNWHEGEAETISDFSSGTILSFMQSYSVECLHFVIRNIIHFIIGLLKIIIITGLLFNINWQIGLFALIAAPFSVYINIIFGKKNKDCGKKRNDAYEKYVGWLCEIASCLKNIRIIGAKDVIKQEFIDKNKEIYEIDVDCEKTKIKSSNIIKFINLCIQMAIFAFSGFLAIKNSMTIGTLMMIVSYYATMTEQIWWTSNTFIDGQRRISYIQSIYDFLNIPLENDNCKQNLCIVNGNICIQNVDFEYKNSLKIIENLSLDIKANDKVAIVGKSGCGKSTLVYLLLAFYKPQAGKITIDNQDISKFSACSIRTNIGLVSQDILIFNTSIRENIIMGNKYASELEIISACKKANIWDFISNLPKQLNTIIGVGGQNISDGQKQRIAIARVYLKNPKIIIFDEATSSLDDKTEEVIIKEWSNVLKNRTAIVISHKLSSIMLCDKVAVIKDGAIDEYDKTEYIVKNNQYFKEIFAISECNQND